MAMVPPMAQPAKKPRKKKAADPAPETYDDLVHFIAPTATYTRIAILTAGFNNDLFDSYFENGDEGTLYKLDVPYVPNGTNATAIRPPRDELRSICPEVPCSPRRLAYRQSAEEHGRIRRPDRLPGRGCP